MKITTARRIAATLLAGSILSVPVAVTGTAAAHAADRASKADRAAMVQANRACTSVPGESEYEACVVGAFILERHRYIDEGYYVADYSDSAPGVPDDHAITLTRASKKV